jgi:ferric-dicitrate binding protein FerR (iron transport regulator)
MELKIDTYKDYAVRDFLLDDAFVAWCRNGSEADDAFWLEVIRVYPQQAINMNDAREFLSHSTVKDALPSAEQIQRMWGGINSELNSRKPKGLVKTLSWLRVAAIVLLVAGAGTLSWLAYSKQKKINTLYAEVKQLELPDHSKITLNANSEIRYSKEWNATKPREVWLTGEAYFEVNHLHKGAEPVKPGDRFIVHANGVEIEVLGTTFNVNNRHNVSKIALTSGSIKLRFDDDKFPAMIMKPGDVVKYSKDSLTFENKEAKSLAEGSWKEHRLLFDSTSLKDVLQIIKDNYGLDARVEDEKLWNKKISGAISSDDKDMLIKGLSVLLEIKIDQQPGMLILKH